MNDPGRKKDPSKALSDRIESALANVHTALPGRIRTYDRTTQRATVDVQLKRLFRPVDMPDREIMVSIPDVPVIMPRAGGYAITFPVAVNDPCLVVFSERDIGGWLENGVAAIPPTARKHDYSDAIAILGLYPTPNALAPPVTSAGLQIRSDDGTKTITVLPSGIEIFSNGAFAAYASLDAEVAADGTLGLSAGTNLLSQAGVNYTMIAGAIMSLVATGAITITPTGAFTVASAGPITITRGTNELLTLISEALDEIATSTVSGSPLSNASNIAAIKTLVDAMRA